MSAPTIESLFLAGPAGRLEAQLKQPAPGAEPPPAAALVCHPHPLFGGTMHNKVVHAAATALSGLGLPVLRFNFRGVGLSAGRHDAGRGEREDAAAAIDSLASRYPGTPLIVAGYSFGGWVALAAAFADPRAAALIAIGAPVALYDFGFLARATAPVRFIQGDRDQFGALPLLLTLAARLPGGAKVLPVAGAQHNFEGHLEELSRRVVEAVPLPGLDPAPGV